MRVAVAGHDCFIYTGTRALERGGPAVVFVHGAANDHSVWALQSRYLAHHGCDVLAADLPGHGRSAGAALRSVEAIADWIVQLLDAAKIARATLVGHSLGALATLDAAARHTARVERIALLGPAVPMVVSEALLDAARTDDPVAFDLIVGWSHSAQRLIGGNPVPGLWMAGTASRLMRRSASGVLFTDLTACAQYARGLEAAAAVQCPALLLIGARDLMAPAKSAEALIARLRDKRVITLAESGHAMMAEQPDAVLDALREFVSARGDR